MAAKIGLNAKLYHGTAGATAATEMANVKDLSMPDERGEADISTRGSGFEVIKSTMRKLSLEWQMLYDELDSDFAAILAAYVGQNAIALKCLSSSTGAGIDADFEIVKITKSENLKDGVYADVVAKPTYLTRYPAWVDDSTT